MLMILATASPALVLVEDGQALASIVIAQKPSISVQLAAYELQSHLQAISSAKLPIVDDSIPVSGRRIILGESQASKALGLHNSDFAKQEYLIQVEDEHMVLMGRDEENFRKIDYENGIGFPEIFDMVGTCYAVYHFLESLGLRWYLPTDLGTAFTKKNNIAVTKTQIRRSPAMRYRELSNTRFTADLVCDSIDDGKTLKPLSNRDTVLYLLRQRIGGDAIKINHSFYTYYDRFLAAHPDWFAQGYEGRPPQLCYTNAEVTAQVIKDGRDYFDGKVALHEVCSNIHHSFKHKVDVFPVFPLDVRSWCKCENCQAMLKKSSDLAQGQFSSEQSSNYIFNFVNKVALALQESHPGKMVGTAAYMDYSYPPDKVSLAENIMVTLCLHTGLFYAEEVKKNEGAILKAWQEKFPRLPKMIWSWYCFPYLTARQQQFRCFPGFFARHVNEAMQEYLAAGATGMFIEPAYTAAGTHGILFDQLELYVTFKLADQPETNAEALIDEFFELYYGPAAAPMRKFYGLMETTYCDPANYPQNTKHQNEEIAWTRLGTEQRMRELAAYMEQAGKAAVASPYKERLALFDRGVWQYMLKGKQDFADREAMLAPTMQQTVAPRLINSEPGNPLTLDWQKAGRISLRYTMKAEISKQKLEARLAHDGEYFYLRYEHQDVDVAGLESKKIPWLNDEWESFFGKQRGRPYQQLAVDAAGKWAGMQYEGTVNQAWQFPGKAISKADSQRRTWQVYLSISLQDLVLNGIKPGEMLYFNVIRSQKTQYLGSWIPTFGGFNVPARMGEVYLAK